MSSDDSAYAIYLLLATVLVGSAFVGRGVPWRQSLKMFAAWIGIFFIGALAFSFRHEIGDRLLERPVVAGDTLRVPISEDGHFYVDAKLNGKTVRMLVDSGASVTTLGRVTAAKAGVEPQGMFPVLVNTANGTTQVRRGRLKTLEVGNIAMDDLPVHLSAQEDVDLIGMNFLSKLSRWSVEGRTLVLVP